MQTTCVESLNISVEVVQNIHKFTQYTHFYLQKMTCLDNNLFMVSFQHIRMLLSTNNRCVASNISVEVDKCVFTNSPSTLTFCLLQRMTVLKHFHGTSLGSLLCYYRCVESLNINVEVAKCGKVSHVHLVQSLFCLNYYSCLSIRVAFNSLGCHAKNDYRCVESYMV